MPTPAFDTRFTREELLAAVPAEGISYVPVAPTELNPDVANRYRLHNPGRDWLAAVEFNPAVPVEERRANLDLLCQAARSPGATVESTGHTPGPWAFEAQGEANLYFILDQDGQRPLARVLFNGSNMERRCLGVLALWDEAVSAQPVCAQSRPLPTPAVGIEVDR